MTSESLRPLKMTSERRRLSATLLQVAIRLKWHTPVLNGIAPLTVQICTVCTVTYRTVQGSPYDPVYRGILYLPQSQTAKASVAIRFLSCNVTLHDNEFHDTLLVI